MSDETEPVVMIYEYATQLAHDLAKADLDATGAQSFLAHAFIAMSVGIPEVNWHRVRLVLTGDLVQSVNDRDDSMQAEPFSIDRGAGFVAGKTMPPNEHGVVDILIHLGFAVPSAEDTEDERAYRLATLDQLLAHETVHARFFHISPELFRAHRRADFGEASREFVSCAGKILEEHLAVYLARASVGHPDTGSEQVEKSFAAWDEEIDRRLFELPESMENYFRRGMEISLTTSTVVWTALTYIAAELRRGDSFEAVPVAIAELPDWVDLVEPYWDRFTGLLGSVPASFDQDPDHIDAVLVELGEFLREWFAGMGFDYHDTDKGAWFQVTRWN